MKMTTDTVQAQIKTFRIYRSIPKYDLVHLANENGLEPERYNSHEKRAAGMTVITYQTVGLCEQTKKVITRPFEI